MPPAATPQVPRPTTIRAAAGCDAVVHLVSIIAGRAADYERVMVQGTRDLVAAAREALPDTVISLFTNGSLLTPGRALSLARAGLDEICISDLIWLDPQAVKDPNLDRKDLYRTNYEATRLAISEANSLAMHARPLSGRSASLAQAAWRTSNLAASI